MSFKIVLKIVYKILVIRKYCSKMCIEKFYNLYLRNLVHKTRRQIYINMVCQNKVFLY